MTVETQPPADLADWYHHRPGCDADTETLVLTRARDGSPLLVCVSCDRGVPLRSGSLGKIAEHTLAAAETAAKRDESLAREDRRHGPLALTCMDCGVELRLHRHTPQVPLCTACKDSREAAKVARVRRRRRAAARNQGRGGGRARRKQQAQEGGV